VNHVDTRGGKHPQVWPRSWGIYKGVMMQYKIILTARKMGGFCKSCIQEFSMTIEANDTADAVEKAKKRSGVNLDTHKININYIKEIR
jgi:hypothetical protein